METGVFWDRWAALHSLQELATRGHAEAAFLLGEILEESRPTDALALVPYVETEMQVLKYETVDEDGLPEIRIIEHDADCPEELRSCGLILKGEQLGLWVMDEDSGERLPDDTMPIDLFLSLPVCVLGLSAEAIGVLGYPSKISEVLILTDEWVLRQRFGEYVLGELHAKFAAIWLDPWALVHQKSREFHLKAANLEHAEAQLKIAMMCERGRNTRQAAEWLRMAAGRGNWGGNWQAQLYLARVLFDFFKAHKKEAEFISFLDLAIAWCERAKCGTDQISWFKTNGDSLLDRMWRCRMAHRS